MDSSELLKKVQLLEQQLDELKSHFPRPGRVKKYFLKFKAGVDGVVAYWVVLAVIVGIAVNSYYRVGVFQNIENIGVNKTSSDYYYKVGENLMEHAEFEAASEAFTTALEINPSNAAARHGLMKSQVFLPAGKDRGVNFLVVEKKLNQLSDPQIFGPDDYLLLYWEGLLKLRQSSVQSSGAADASLQSAGMLFGEKPSAAPGLPGASFKLGSLEPLNNFLFELNTSDTELAKAFFRQSISRKPNFLGSHFELGNTYLSDGDVAVAAGKYRDALALDDRFAPALANLGYCRVVLATFVVNKVMRGRMLDAARRGLQKAEGISPGPEIALYLGDSYLFDSNRPSNFKSAKVSYQNALESLAGLSAAEREKPVSNIHLYLIFLPTDAESCDNRNTALELATPEELKAVILYSLSLTSAMLGDKNGADKSFSDATSLPSSKYYGGLFKNKICAALHLLKPEAAARRWLVDKLGDYSCSDACGTAEN